MRIIIIVVSICTAMLFGGCASQSLLSDEEYYERKGPAPNSPDPMGHIPGGTGPSARY